jgi:hypothetical protein
MLLTSLRGEWTRELCNLEHYQDDQEMSISEKSEAGEGQLTAELVSNMPVVNQRRGRKSPLLSQAE